MRPLRSALGVIAGFALTLALVGCSSLTRPEEITIQAEPANERTPTTGAIAKPQGPAPQPAQQPEAAPAGGCGN